MSRSIGIDGLSRSEMVVLDTNVVLDLLVFADPATRDLLAALQVGALVWLATPAMRDELERVLGYAPIQVRLQAQALDCAQVLAQFDQLSHCHGAAPACGVACSDRDDQMFIDLAASHRALLLSKDAAILRLRRRLAPRGVQVQALFKPAT